MRALDVRWIRVVPLVSLAALIGCGGDGTGPGANASRLAFTVQPSTVAADATIGPAVQVTLQDPSGNTVTGATHAVTIAITTGTGVSGATLTGTLTQNAVNGVATFTDLGIQKAGTGYTITATAEGLTSAVSDPFSVNPGAPAKLIVQTQPGSSLAGFSVVPGPQILIEDAHGNTVSGATNAVTLAITGGTGTAGATLSGTFTQTPNGGVATFNAVKVDKVGTGYTLTASADGLTSATTGPFDISHGPAAKLGFSTQPTDAVSSTSISPAMQVTVQDAYGNTVTSSAAAIALNITSGTGVSGAILSGTRVRNAQSGIATFNDIRIDKAATNYTLTAIATGLTGATSTPFSVSVGAPAKLGFVVQPTAAAQGANVAPSVQVAVQDAGGNTVTSAAPSISVALTSGTGGTSGSGAVLGGTLSQAAVSGIASFADLSVDRPGTGFTLTASSAGLTNGVSSAFTINGATINGTITLVSTFLSARAAPLDALRVSSRRTVTSGSLVTSSVSAPAKLRQFATSTASRSAARQPRPTRYMPGELIVTFRQSASPPLPAVRAMTVASLSDVDAALRGRAQRLVPAARARVIGSSAAIRAVRLRVSDAAQLESVKAALEADPTVERVERNAIMESTYEPVPAARRRMAPRVVPNDPDYVGQRWHYDAIDLDIAWGRSIGSASILVAVVDDGIRFDHPDIAPNLTTDGYDFVSSAVVPLCAGGTVDLAGDGNGPDSDPTKPNEYEFDATGTCVTATTAVGVHGLHVAGTIGAAGNNAQGGTGVNWTVRIRPIRVLNSAGAGSIYDIAQGILYAAGLPADNGSGTAVQANGAAKVINLSLGGPTTSLDLENAIAAAVAKGSLLVAAAGNTPSSVPNYPAAYPEVISVSAVGPDLNLASYSSFGSTVDIAAPGGDILDGSDTGGQSYGVWSTSWDFSSNTPTYKFAHGTSMAAPHVSGVAALIFAQSSFVAASTVRQRLESFAVDLGPAGRDDSYGVGLLNARNSLTQTTSLSGFVRARLYNASTGAAVATATATGTGTYSFTQVPAGSYWIFGGQDEEGDTQIGVPRRRWTAFGGTSTPTTVTASGTTSQTVSFSIGHATEIEPNDATASANVLVVGGYLFGFGSGTDADYSTVLVPTAGQYTFETQGYRGACGFAEELDTILELYDSAGTLIASNDDINAGALNLCSRITTTLTAGRYYLRVTGSFANTRRYYLTARSG